jgi:APA family basic amino acid/polyamine antiporter
MQPHAGGMYGYLRESFSPLLGFLYGWTFWTVIQTGTIAAVAIAFARYTGVLFPGITESHYLIAPLHFSSRYAVSLSTSQLLAIGIILLLAIANCFGVKLGKIVQNVFTSAKLGALGGVIVLGFLLGTNKTALHENFAHPWTAQGVSPLAGGLTAATGFGLFVAICLSQTGSLFAADSWHDITFVAAEVKRPKRNLPLALLIGPCTVILLYLLCNAAYLLTLPLETIQHTPSDRIAAAMLEKIFPGIGASLLAAAIMASTFGTVNALSLAGARACYAIAKDGLFFSAAKRLNRSRVPGFALILQGLWAALLVLPRTYNPATNEYGSLYSDLLDYVISAALLFYILTMLGLIRLRRLYPNAERPYKVWGYPFTPIIYVIGASAILLVLFVYNPGTTWPGLGIVALGVPVYFLLRRKRTTEANTEELLFNPAGSGGGE